MDILFVKTQKRSKHSHPENVRPSLDIGYSASLLKQKEHETSFIDMKLRFFDKKDILSIFEREKPDIVIFKSQTPSYDLTLELASDMRESEKNFYIGVIGQHATVSPESFVFEDSPIDFCVIGEPEKAIEKLADSLESGEDFREVSGIFYYSEGNLKVSGDKEIIDDLDKLPFPNHDMFLDKGYREFLPIFIKDKKKYGYVLSSRGCPYDCVYCSPTLRVTYGDEFRTRDPENVVDEIEHLVDKGVNIIIFKDDIFTFSRDHTIDICKEILNRGLDVNWFAQTRGDCLDYELLKYMKLAGCKTLGIGVESGSSRILKLLNKGETKEDIREGFEMVKKAGIKTVGNFMLGSPTETKEELESSLEFCRELKPDMIQVAFSTPYPGSKLYEEDKFGAEANFKEFSHYNEVTSNLSNVSDATLKNFQKKFYKSYILSYRFIFKYLRNSLFSMPFNFKEQMVFFKKSLKFLYNV